MSVTRKTPEKASRYTQNYPSERSDYERRRREDAQRRTRPSIADAYPRRGRRGSDTPKEAEPKEEDIVADPEGARRHGETPAA